MVKGWFDLKKEEEKKIKLPQQFLQDYTEIFCDPTNADKVYLSVWGGSLLKPIIGGVWSSQNGGDQWFAAMRLGSGFQKDPYWKIAQPGKTNRNADPGVAENKIPDFVHYENRGVRAIAISADGTLYAGTFKGYHTYKYDAENDFWTSVDNTRVGELFYGHGNNDTGAFGITPDIHRPGEMFLLQYEASAYKSTTSTHPEFPGIVGVKRIPALIDIGPKWAPGQPFNAPITIASHPSDPNIFYYISQRSGEVRKCRFDENTHVTMGKPIEVPPVISVPKMKCIYWSDLQIARDGQTMYALAEVIDQDNRPMGQTRIYNPLPQKGIYKSLDEGKSWKCLNQGLPETAGGRNQQKQVVGSNSACVKTLLMSPDNDQLLYAAVKKYHAPEGKKGMVNGGLYRSVNGSESWDKLQIPEGIRSVWDVWLHQNKGQTRKIYIAGGGMEKAEESGEGGVWVAHYKANGDYKKEDWQKIFDHPFVCHVRTSPVNPDILLVATRESYANGKRDAGTFYSTTGGGLQQKNWIKFNHGRGGMMIGDIQFDSGNPKRVWCSVESSGIYTALLPINKQMAP
ncbi:hypothetical protein [Persicobacter diffluens]|uniref:Exo-alpha-sialidase n=1 Tax=Persicobacter diffluens TaxID=981 RepID=A0AAN4W0Z4_9BACT|nr:hypothetical protein PEDI_30570 [Persicobacter diffluens]